MVGSGDQPQPEQRVHERTETPPAPGDLELVRSFLSLHGHLPGNPDSLAPTPANIEWWLREQALIDEGSRLGKADLRFVAEVLEALRSLVVLDDEAGPPEQATFDVLDRAARRARLEPRFDATYLEPRATGVPGAIGRVLAVAFRSRLDESWVRFKHCGNPACRSVFFDRSKNHSGKWCMMKDCGNRAKVRAWRARQAALR